MTKHILFFLVINGLCLVMEAYIYNPEGFNTFVGHVNNRHYGRFNPYFRPMMKRSEGFFSNQESLDNTIQNHINHIRTTMDNLFQNLDKMRPPQLDNTLENGTYNGSGVVKIIITCCINGSCVTVHDPISLNCSKILENNAKQGIDDDQKKEEHLVNSQEKVTDIAQSQDINETPVDGQQEIDSIQTAEAEIQ